MVDLDTQLEVGYTLRELSTYAALLADKFALEHPGRGCIGCEVCTDISMLRITAEALEDLGDAEYEYGWAGDERATTFYDTKERAEEFMGEPRQYRREKPGKWVEVANVE